ncbi:MAG: type II secretion system F family protein [Acidimicrobiales bacterium]|nr:type II secretion system F family protein [Acidimicrobiales bacterium]
MSQIAVVASGIGFALGCLGLLAWAGAPPGLEGEGDPLPDHRHGAATVRTKHRRFIEPRTVRRLAVALAVGLVTGLVTGWPAAVPIGALAAGGLPVLFGKTRASGTIAKIEAVATWTEMLHGTLAASAGLNQAIVVTAPLSPMPIRSATVRLAGLLESGAPPGDALLGFAEEVDDPSADRVVCALLLAYSSRGHRLGDLLSALADSTRNEAALRLRIETSRAAVRSSVRTVLVFSVAFAVGLLIVARSYLAPFGTPTGQVVLVAVALLYAGGLSAMVAMARPPAPVRLLGQGVLRQ